MLDKLCPVVVDSKVWLDCCWEGEQSVSRVGIG